ncbi:MAG: hypothetical protein HY017_05210 [Betaproteobacteria bacterium]|nr:hypothetical protein [Betaproteobacteria bacterium]
MTDFQFGLLAIGVLAVLGVLAYNKVQERRVRRETLAAFEPHHADALLERGTEPAPRIEPAISPRAVHSADEHHAPGALPDERIDYVLELRAGRPIAAHEFFFAWAPSEHRFAQRALFAGQSDGRWQPLPREGNFTGIRAALQLVNRRGLVNEAELLEFRSALETLCAKIGATVEAPEMKQALDRGRALDAICADADIQVVIHVVPSIPGRFPGAEVRKVAESAGLQPGPDGRYLLRGPDEHERFYLYDRSGAALAPGGHMEDSVQALTLAMDVPRAPETARSFGAMTLLARDLAAALHGRLVDDNDRPLDEKALVAIGQQLEPVRAQLEAQGIAPGGALALRLFS